MPLGQTPEGLNGAGYGTTTTTAPASDPSQGSAGNGWAPPSAASTGPAMTSAWGKDFTSRAAIRRNKYTDPGSGEYSPLRKRLFEWRTEFVQSGDANLEAILDYYLRWDAPRAPKRGGIGGRIPQNSGSGGGQRTVAGWLEEFRTADQEQMSEYQQMLWQAGYYSPKVYKNPALLRKGRYDDSTQDAINRMLKDAVMGAADGTVTSLKDLLADRAAEMEEAGGVEAFMASQGDGQAPGPFTAAVTNPADIEAQARATGYDLMGRQNVDTAGMVPEYQGLEVASQRAGYDLTVSGQEGVATEAPTLGTYVESELRQNNTAEVDGYATLGAFNELLRMIGAAG